MKGFFKGCALMVVGAIALIIVIVIIVAVVAGNNGQAGFHPKPGAVGSYFRVPDNLDLTLTGVTISKGAEFEKPKPGLEYAICHFRFHNFRSSTTDVASTGFEAQSAGVVRDPEFVTTVSKNTLDEAGTRLAPKGVLRADLVFQVKIGKPAEVLYTPNGQGNDPTVKWRIQG